MQIENRTIVTLKYRLTTDEGGQEIEVEQTTPEQPFVFLFGSGGLLPEFEKNLEGKSPGDTFDFRISAENGYGSSDPQNIVPVPLTAFHNEEGKADMDMLQIGNVLPMSDSEGNHYQARVHELNVDHVKMDFNHPLADKELHFAGEVLDVRLATLEELQHQHVHGEGGHAH